MRQPNHLEFLWHNVEFRVRAIEGLKICSLKPFEPGTVPYLLRSVCFSVMAISQITLTRLNSQKI